MNTLLMSSAGEDCLSVGANLEGWIDRNVFMSAKMSETRLAFISFDFLLDKRGFPSSALAVGQYGDEHHQPTVVVAEPGTERVLCIIEKLDDDDPAAADQRAGLCYAFLRRQKLQVPAYLFTASCRHRDQLKIFILDSKGQWQPISANHFPTYEELVSLKLPRVASGLLQKSAADDFARVTGRFVVFLVFIFVLSIAGSLELYQEELWLLAGIAGFVVLPYYAKIKVFGVEGERPQEPASGSDV
jgi:hypothetical protein